MDLNEQFKIVHGLGAVNLSGSTHLSDLVCFKYYGQATAVINIGANAGAFTINTIEASAANSSGIAYCSAFNYKLSSTGPDDALGSRTVGTSSGISSTTSANCMVVIERDASENSSGKEWWSVNFSDPSANTYASVQYFMGQGRYQRKISPTAIA